MEWLQHFKMSGKLLQQWWLCDYVGTSAETIKVVTEHFCSTRAVIDYEWTTPTRKWLEWKSELTQYLS